VLQQPSSSKSLSRSSRAQRPVRAARALASIATEQEGGVLQPVQPVQAAALVAAADMYALQPKAASVAGGLLTVLALFAALAYTAFQVCRCGWVSPAIAACVDGTLQLPSQPAAPATRARTTYTADTCLPPHVHTPQVIDYSRMPANVSSDVQWSDMQGPFPAAIRCTAPSGCWVSNRCVCVCVCANWTPGGGSAATASWVAHSGGRQQRAHDHDERPDRCLTRRHNDRWSSNGATVEAAQQGGWVSRVRCWPLACLQLSWRL
jgi:hypothetical protein